MQRSAGVPPDPQRVGFGGMRSGDLRVPASHGSRHSRCFRTFGTSPSELPFGIFAPPRLADNRSGAPAVRCGGNARPRRIQGATRPRFRAEPPLQENGSPQRCGIRWLEYWLETLGDRGKTANWLKLSRTALASALIATRDWLMVSQPRFHHGLPACRMPAKSLLRRR